jgi:transposase-like protein
MSVQQRRKYDPDFKRNAVQLTEEPGRTVADVAEKLGISKDILYRWRQAQRVNQKLAFPGNGREALTHHQQKIRELEKSEPTSILTMRLVIRQSPRQYNPLLPDGAGKLLEHNKRIYSHRFIATDNQRININLID